MINNLVINDNGRATTTSLKVAEVFGKQHYDVLKRINTLKEELNSAGFDIDGNFSCNEYTDSIGRKLPYYNLTRDGYTLLVMGFTGKKALEFKLKYIEAFNTMEAKLKDSVVRIRETTYQRLTDMINTCIDTRMEKWEKLISKPKYDFDSMDLTGAEKAKLSVVDDMNKAIKNYGKVCEAIARMQGVLSLKKVLPDYLYAEIGRCIKERSASV